MLIIANEGLDAYFSELSKGPTQSGLTSEIGQSCSDHGLKRTHPNLQFVALITSRI